MPRLTTRFKAFFFIGIVALTLALAGYLDRAYQVPVLMYHHIDANSATSRLSVSPESFARQLRFLSEHQYRVMPLSEYAELLRSGRKHPKRTVVMTFDDGYADNYTAAFPLLKKYEFPGTVFVVVDWIGSPGMLTWPQMREMVAGGLIDIGSHSLTHCDLAQAQPEELRRQLVESKQILETGLQDSVDFLCYPCGFFTQAVLETVKAAGYKGACATHPGKEISLQNEYAMRRIRISGSADNVWIFRAQISGYYNFLKDHRVNTKRVRRSSAAAGGTEE